jgi:hypothetical protein
MMCCIIGCNNKKNKTPVARVGDAYLYQSDIEHLFSNDISKEDSVKIRNGYIEKWIKRQLLLERAELNLPDKEKDIQKLIDDYRTTLLIYKYKQQLLAQKLDTLIPEKEKREYYSDNKDNFILGEPLAKVLYIKLPVDAPKLNRVKRWYKSTRENDIAELENYCFQFAEKYDDFQDDWVKFREIMMDVPYEINNEDRFLKYNRSIQAKDSTHLYLIHIRELMEKGEYAPFEFVNDNITNILLNKRKIEFIKNLEYEMYEDAIAKEKFKVFEKEERL